MRLVQDTILQRLGKALHVHIDDITHEPLPRRWVELILYLDEQERERSARHEPETSRTGGSHEQAEAVLQSVFHSGHC